MDQQELMKAQFIYQQVEEMQTHLEMLEREMAEMALYEENLKFLSENKQNEMIASIGKGIHVKANMSSSDLYVEVGAGVVVKKTPSEALRIVSLQYEKLKEARLHLINKIEIYQKTLEATMRDIQKSQNQNKQD